MILVYKEYFKENRVDVINLISFKELLVLRDYKIVLRCNTLGLGLHNWTSYDYLSYLPEKAKRKIVQVFKASLNT